MTDPRQLLDQITERAEAWATVDMHSDIRTLVGVARAVLAYADKIDHPDHYENAEREETCVECHKRNPFRGGAYWPCPQRKHAEAIRNAITEALGGTHG